MDQSFNTLFLMIFFGMIIYIIAYGLNNHTVSHEVDNNLKDLYQKGYLSEVEYRIAIQQPLNLKRSYLLSQLNMIKAMNSQVSKEDLQKIVNKTNEKQIADAEQYVANQEEQMRQQMQQQFQQQMQQQMQQQFQQQMTDHQMQQQLFDQQLQQQMQNQQMMDQHML